MLTDQVGDSVYIRGQANGYYKVAKADPGNLNKMPVVGVIIRKWDFTSALMQVAGEVRGIYSGLTPGKQYWVGPSSRPIRFADFSPGPGERYLAQELGQALDVGVLWLLPSHIVTVSAG
jgi:hypothetical protein